MRMSANNINPRDNTSQSSFGQQNALRQLGNRVGVASVVGVVAAGEQQPNHRQQFAGNNDRYERVANAESRNRIIAAPPIPHHAVAQQIGEGVYEEGKGN